MRGVEKEGSVALIVSSQSRRRVAIVGSGISGLSAAWMLDRSLDVTVYEAQDRVGGHSHTVGFATDAGVVPVDIGFIVYNEQTYPNLTALFAHLHVATHVSDMSLAVSLDGGRLEYAGGYLTQLFAQRRNILRPRFWSMLRDLVRFYRQAPKDLEWLATRDVTLGQYLETNRYGAAFRDDHLLPMAAAIWSVPAGAVLDFPAYAFIRFQENHGLLKLAGRPLWRTVTGGSAAYVEKLTAPYADRIRLNAAVEEVERHEDYVLVRARDGSVERYDEVVIAAHADQALAMVSNASPLELRLLGAFRYKKNDAILHSDTRLMPRRRRAWASWNYIGRTGPGGQPDLTVTYWMNQLQGVGGGVPLFVTLNADPAPDPDKVVMMQTFEHPVMDKHAVAAQAELWSLQGADRIWYCGAYFGAGFHEDGLQAGLAVAEAITGERRPWQVANESGRITILPRHGQAAGLIVGAAGAVAEATV